MITVDVAHCAQCPFVYHDDRDDSDTAWTCVIDDDHVRTIPSGLMPWVDEPPDWCPLRVGPRLVQLRSR